ncbi:hypothetical protein PV08_11134 [Exophiala spinifera]|uniref:Signal peptide peptidase n=1 Tax=Exophiala spinifera TaxID=91928 RepID=A0A0D2ATV8_9EURO|nr:uncharacterized protein PV08_11134 [Exophiala spinifera]KIW10173.1 hypothetical protein PV08_11134 [Exophiala spinifera]
MASTPGPVMELLGRVAYEIEVMRPLFPTYLHLLISAIFPIYTAAHAALSRPPSASPRKRKEGSTDDDLGDDGESQKIESLTPSDAVLFPLLAGATLASLYFILKWLQDPAWLNWALGIYFSQIGLFFAVKFIKDTLSIARSFLFPDQYSRGGNVWKANQSEHSFKTETGDSSPSPFPWLLWPLPIPTSISRRIWQLRGLLYTKARLDLHVHQLITVKSSIDLLDLMSLLLSVAIVSYHAFVAKPWFITNFLGFSFCYGSLQYMTPTTAWTGTLVLSALFFYDIYFVFFTPMMVTVATQLDVPIKLLFPRPDGCVFPVGAAEGSVAMEEYLQCLAKTRTMAMLGLGDIVVPGMMLAFALRFDLFLFYLRQGRKVEKGGVETEKPVYASAKGNWGERFWTRPKLWSDDIKAKSFPKPYFYATIVGYVLGMIMTVVVMQVAEHAQPALLYLVPGVLFSLWGTALVKGDLKALWDYTEASEEEKDEGKKEDKNSQQQKADTAIQDHLEVESKREKKPGKKSPEEKAEKQSRRLILFSITLPQAFKRTGQNVTGNEQTSTEASSGAKTTADNGDGRDMGARRSLDEAEARSREGEPPEKRARRV